MELGLVFIILLLLIIACDVNDIKKKQTKKTNNKSQAIHIEKTPSECELERLERENWKPKRMLFVTKEMKEQIFGEQE